MPRHVCDPFNYAPYVVISKGFKSGLLGGQNGSRGEQLGLSWQFQRASVISLMCTICIEDPPREFDCWLVYINNWCKLTDAFRKDCHPKSALEPFQRLRGSSQCVLSSDFSSLVYWNLRWTVLKSYILPHRHKQLISDIQRTELFPLLSAQCEGFDGRGSSIILRI